MSYIFLIIGTLLFVVFTVFLFKGDKYEYMISPLTGDAFPIKTIYSAGLAIQDLKVGKLKGKFGDALRADAALLYGRNYGEFYSRIIWAQMISFPLLTLSIFFVLAGAVSGTQSKFFCIVGIALAIIFYYYFYSFTKDKIKKRKDECEAEFPNAISKLALLVNSGVILHNAWEAVAYGKEGVFYDMMKKSCELIKNGKSDIEAIYDFGDLINSDDIKKFTSALIQSIERGGGELPDFLTNQSIEIWDRKRQVTLQKGEKAAGALLMPISLMLLGVMLIVITAAFSSFSI